MPPQQLPRRAILLIQTAFIGDVILATALLERLRQTEPNTPVDFLVRKGNEGLIEQHPHVRDVLIWDKKNHKYLDLFRLLRTIRAGDYERVITLQRFASTGLLTALSGAPKRIGFDKNPLSFAFTQVTPHLMGQGIHEVTRNLHLLYPESEAPLTPPRLFPTPADEATVASYATRGPYVCIAPTSVWFTKQFPEEQWLKLIRALPPHYSVYLLGAPSDSAVCERLRQESGRASVVNLAGQLPLLASAALMRGAVLNYVNDSAPLHLCSAMGAPTCAVFCSTVPFFGFGPLSPFSRVVQIEEDLACQPCGLHGHKKCPLGHFYCARGIRTQQLIDALTEAEAWAAAQH